MVFRITSQLCAHSSTMEFGDSINKHETQFKNQLINDDCAKF